MISATPEPLHTSDDRMLTREACTDILRRVYAACTEDGEVSVSITGWWNGELRWARNRVWVASDRRDLRIGISRRIAGGDGLVIANQTDDESLRAAVVAAERVARRTAWGGSREFLPPPPLLVTPSPHIWSDVTYNVTADAREALARTLMDDAESAGMLTAGSLDMRAGFVMQSNGDSGSLAWDNAQQAVAAGAGAITYQTYTQAQCSMTVRHPQGRASGWAGRSGYDWATIDGAQLARRALQKCVASMDPVRIEPGRYTVVLEAQATADLLAPLVQSFERMAAEQRGVGPWVLGFDADISMLRTKLGVKVVDDRVTISHDPMDPDLGVLPWAGMTSLVWIDKGILRTLEYDRTGYALPRLNEATDASGRMAFRMSGGTATVDEMVEGTQRGLLVSRFSSVGVLDGSSLLSTGVTRDGLWLIEQGKITKAVHNMRFTESPLFVLNQLDQLGEPMPLFRPAGGDYTPGVTPALVPPIKAKDFSFTSLNDSI